jgi:hypothetical protein
LGAGRKFAELKKELEKQQIPNSTREGFMGAKRTEITSLGFGCWEEICGTINKED